MRRKNTMLVVVMAVAATLLAAATLGRVGQERSLMAELEVVRTRTAEPIIRHGGGGWKDSQVQEPRVFQDPEDGSKLIMFLAAMAAPLETGTMSVGVAVADRDNPTSWEEYADNPILKPGLPGEWDDRWIRLDSVVPLDNGGFMIYYTGHSARDQIGMARVWREGGRWYSSKNPANPILSPSGDETDVSQSAVIADAGEWYMYYSYRGTKGCLPGLRLATSKDGIHFAKRSGDALSCGQSGSQDSCYIESHQVLRRDREVIVSYEAYDGKNWRILGASSPSPLGPFKKWPKPLLEGTGKPGSFDGVHVATPYLVEIEGGWFLFYQGASLGTDYGKQSWDMGVVSYAR